MTDLPPRPIGNLEKYMIVRNQLKIYNNIEVGATYTVPQSTLNSSPDHPLDGLVYSALAETLKSHPILGVKLEDEKSADPKWIRLPNVDLRKLVNFIQEDSPSISVKWIEAGHRKQLDRMDELPLWRVVVAFDKAPPKVSESAIFTFSMAFFAHHAIADGVSAGVFHLTFLDSLNHLIDHTSEISYQPIIALPKMPLVPNLELTTRLPVSFNMMLKLFFKTYIYDSVDPLKWSGPAIDANTPRPPHPNLRSFSLPYTTVSKIASRCRNEKTTVTALVTVLAAHWLGTTYTSHKRFCCKIPFSLRKFSKHAPRDTGCYASDIGLYFSSETKPPRDYISCFTASTDGTVEHHKHLWDSARACKAVMDKQSSTIADQNVGLLQLLGDITGFFLKTFGTKRQYGFEVSNIGVLDGGVKTGGEKKRATFDRVTFSTAQFTCGNPYTIFLATAKNGYMTVSSGWETGIVGEEEAVNLLSFLEKELRGLDK